MLPHICSTNIWTCHSADARRQSRTKRQWDGNTCVIDVKIWDICERMIMLVNIIIIYLQLLLVTFAESAAPIADSVFKQMAASPDSWGVWEARARCELDFSGTSLNQNTAYMLIKFSVPISYYRDYISNTIETDTNGRWVITSPKHTYTNSIYFELDFEYNMFLGTSEPQGSCRIYMSLAAARGGSNTLATASTPADPKLDSIPLSVTTSQAFPTTTTLYLNCRFSLAAGIRFGANEGFALLMVSAPFTDYTDYWGTNVVQAATDNTWVIVRYSHASNLMSYLDYNPVITVDKADVSGISGTCELWVEQTDCILFAQSIGSTTTIGALPAMPATTATTTSAAIVGSTSIPTTPSPLSTTVSTTTSSSVPVTSTTTSSSVPVAVTSTTTPPLAVSTATSTAVSPCALSGNADCLREVTTMRDTLVTTGSELWTVPSPSGMGCGRKCINDGQCVSVFYSTTDRLCIGHSSIYTSGSSTPGVKYYVRE